MFSTIRWRGRAWWLIAFLPCAVVLAGTAASQRLPHLQLYRNDHLEFEMKVPKRWIQVDGNMMVAFRSQNPGPGTSIGVYRQAQAHIPVQLMANRAYQTWKRPKDWTQHLMRVGNLQAMEVEMQPDGDASRRLLLFLVDAQIGYWGYYLIECQAPTEQWTEQKALFQNIVQSFKNI